MNPFQWLNEVKEWKIFFFAQRANTRKQASSSDALAPTVQHHAGARCPDDTSASRRPAALKPRTSMTSGAHMHRWSLSKRRELVLSSLSPPPPFFSQILGPRSLRLRVSFPCLCSAPVCIIRSVTSLSLATTTWTPEQRFSRFTAIRTHHPISHVCLGEAPSRLPHTVFPPEGLLLSRPGGCSPRPCQG